MVIMACTYHYLTMVMVDYHGVVQCTTVMVRRVQVQGHLHTYSVGATYPMWLQFSFMVSKFGEPGATLAGD
jgi:hypothetical protein